MQDRCSIVTPHSTQNIRDPHDDTLIGLRLCFKLAAAFVLALPTHAESQASPGQARSLASPSARLPAEFTQIASITELADGRILIADRREGIVSIADLSSGAVVQVGRRGQGPGEYSNVTPILPLGGDSALMADAQSRRWLIFKGGAIARTVPPDAAALVATRGLVTGADANGFLIARKSTLLNERPAAGDSVIVLRVVAASGAVDTIAKLGPSATRTQVRYEGGDRPQAIRITTPIMAVEEQELLFPDGWIAIARLEPYRVDWRTPKGAWIRGGPLPFREVRVDDREKQAFRERRLAVGLRPPPDVAEWATTIPPFLPSFPSAALLAAPDGRLVIARTPTASRAENRYDIVDRNGKLTGELVLPINARIAAIGNRGVYVVTTTEDGIEQISRHPWSQR